MIKKALKTTCKLILLLIIIAIDFFLKQSMVGDPDVISANIDGGFIIILLMGLSYGGYKLYTQENSQ